MLAGGDLVSLVGSSVHKLVGLLLLPVAIILHFGQLALGFPKAAIEEAVGGEAEQADYVESERPLRCTQGVLAVRDINRTLAPNKTAGWTISSNSPDIICEIVVAEKILNCSMLFFVVTVLILAGVNLVADIIEYEIRYRFRSPIIGRVFVVVFAFKCIAKLNKRILFIVSV